MIKILIQTNYLQKNIHYIFFCGFLTAIRNCYMIPLVFVCRCKMGLQHDVDEPLSLKGLVDLFHMLQDEYYEEYKVCFFVDSSQFY